MHCWHFYNILVNWLFILLFFFIFVIYASAGITYLKQFNYMKRFSWKINQVVILWNITEFLKIAHFSTSPQIVHSTNSKLKKTFPNDSYWIMWVIQVFSTFQSSSYVTSVLWKTYISTCFCKLNLKRIFSFTKNKKAKARMVFICFAGRYYTGNMNPYQKSGTTKLLSQELYSAAQH